MNCINLLNCIEILQNTTIYYYYSVILTPCVPILPLHQHTLEVYILVY
nr:MAG TPA: hypothetical protein [Caudoviricetes sp.]